MAGRRPDVPTAAGERYSFTHAGQPQPTAGRMTGCHVQVEADPVIVDFETHNIIALFKRHGGTRRARVSGDVVQRLLCDAVEHRLVF